jgi:tetratricopeptide (TPR) repeat protein
MVHQYRSLQVILYNLLLIRSLILLLLSAFLAGCTESGEEVAEHLSLDPVAIAANNRGVGLMGRFEYSEARDVFAELAERYPDWHDVRVNLAIATLNRQLEGDEELAMAIARQVLVADPDNLRAHYVMGILTLYSSVPEEAAAYFRFVVDSDPNDAYAAYFLAQSLAQAQDFATAHELYQRAILLDPYLLSAYYGDLQALQRLGRRADARTLTEAYRRLSSNPRARLAEFKYTRMGPKGNAVATNSDSPEPVREAPAGPLFADPFPVAKAPGGRALTVADANADGLVDIFVSGESGGKLLLGKGEGIFVTTRFAPGALDGIRAALWGDYDNDGLIDLYLCRKGPNQLWHQSSSGSWEDVSTRAGATGGEADTVAGRMFDADHDGDLDIFLVTAKGPNELLNNNLDGTFRPIAVEQGIAGDGRSSRGLVVTDLDADRDLDLLVINTRPPHEVYLNDRLWTYRPSSDLDSFATEQVLAAVSGDLDTDGLPELYALTPTGLILRWRKGEDGIWERAVLSELQTRPVDSARIGLLDARGDGVPEILVATSGQWRLIDSASGEILFDSPAPEGRSMLDLSPILTKPERGPALITLDSGGAIALHPAGPGRFPFLSLSFSGREDHAQSMRSNASGLGARVSVRTGSRWSVRETLPSLSSPGQSLQPLSIGLGGSQQADFAAIDWSDGVFQSELDLPVGKVQRIEETQRQLSSCPVLFAWNGERYAFVTDLLGVGGIGYAVGPGQYAEPRPWEHLLLPNGLLQPKDDRLVLKITEPMEEAAYIDSVRLAVWDLPPGWDLVVDERMGISGPEPTGKPLVFRRELTPRRALNDRGQDVTARIRERDLDAAPVGERDHRFIGRLRDEHILTLSLPQPIDPALGRPVLVADGWVEYPYSQTMFAAWQAGADYRAPTLEARDSEGNWHLLIDQFGYPAGMPRRMALPLPELPAGTDALRLRTNMEVYWDRLSVVYAEELRDPVRGILPLLDARVAVTGFPICSRGAQMVPSYDYGNRKPFWDTRYQAGFYTRPGPAEELVRETDDALAVIGAGEEIQIAFAAPPSQPAGWSRRYVLQARGWTKDMDLFTKEGDTLEPLPSSGRGGMVRELLHARFNTRFQAGR